MAGSETQPGVEPITAIVVMGVSASGKSAAGAAIARAIGFDFVDGDDLHPASNVVKMTSGTPLTDEDRAPWLDRIGTELADRARHPHGLVIACSALRRPYRDRIRIRTGVGLLFVFLDIPIEEARRRIAGRTGHFMPPSLIDSQFATLERPDGEADVLAVTLLADVASTAQAAVETITRRMHPT